MLFVIFCFPIGRSTDPSLVEQTNDTTPDVVALSYPGDELNVDSTNLCFLFSFSVPDINVSGRLSSVGASLDYSQYCFILGMLGENLGEPLEEFERPSSVIQDPLGKVTGTGVLNIFLSPKILVLFLTVMLFCLISSYILWFWTL